MKLEEATRLLARYPHRKVTSPSPLVHRQQATQAG